MTITKEMQKNGWDAEEALRKMLDREGFAHLPFCDNASKFSKMIREFFGSKRPDIMVLFRYIGFLLVEVKHKKIYKGCFYINHEEAKKYQRFREEFGHEVWYAISNSENGFKDWYWIPARQTMRHKRGKINGDLCITIPVEEFIKVSTFTDFVQILLQTKKD